MFAGSFRKLLRGCTRALRQPIRTRLAAQPARNPVLEHLEDRIAPTVNSVLPGWDALQESTLTSGRREVVVVDPRVPDLQQLLAGVQPGTRILMLSPTQDGLDQIAAALAGPAQTTDIQIIGHGSSGAMLLGDDLLDAASLTTDTTALQQLRAELGPDSDLLLYGCQTGAGTAGTAFVTSLAKDTGATVAASSTIVGATALGENWDLNVTTGPIDADGVLSPASLGAYPFQLGISISTTSLPAGQVNQVYNNSVSVTGDTPPDSVSVSSGSLPAGLSLTGSTGTISGTPTTANFANLATFAGDVVGAYSTVVEDANGNLYGTTTTDGYGFGTVYEVAAETHALTTLVAFNVANGATPVAGLFIDSSGNLFGTTENGGAYGDGTVFEIPAGTATLTTLVSFNEADGANPVASLIEDTGTHTLYGTTQNGGTTENGATGAGTVFSLALSNNALTTLHTFNYNDGANPVAGLTENTTTQTLYGTTENSGTTESGATGSGTVFSLALSNNALTTLATFDGDNGSGPASNLVADASNNLYGTTTGAGGTDGTVFEISATSQQFTNLATFDGSDGQQPEGNLIEYAGNIYGTTSNGGSSDAGTAGTLFEIAGGTHALTALFTFTGSNGANPAGGLYVDGNGDLYGTTPFGGATLVEGTAGDGTVFEVPAGSQSPTTLVNFTDTGAANPTAGVVEDSNGNLFGTTEYGGTDNDGTVYEVAAATHTLTTLYSFTGPDGENPLGSLLIDSNGDLFGTTENGGNTGYGTVFELSPGSNSSYTLTTLYSFSGSDGAYPAAGLIQDGNGDLFGTTLAGGSSFDGTLFELTPESQNPIQYQFSSLASFDGTDGINPVCNLYEDGNGDLFGTTRNSTNGYGVVFEYSGTNHTLTTPVTFNYTNGAYPLAGLIAYNGNLYGTTSGGGSEGQGTVFEVSPAGNSSYTLSTLIDFTGSNGSTPQGSLLVDSNGNLFGTTSSGGMIGNGTVFELSLATGALTNLVNFDTSDGSNPESNLIEDANGNLYGTTFNGAVFTTSGQQEPIYGTVFEVSNRAFTIEATDSTDSSSTQSLAIEVDPVPTLMTTTLSPGIVGHAYSQTLATAPALGPVSFAVTSNSLPPGLNLNATTGAITGTPTTATGSPFSFTITTTDSNGDSASQTYSLVISTSSLIITTSSLPNWTLDQPYDQAIAETGGTGSLTWSVSSGTLPTGLTLNTSTGIITGTPTTTTGSPFSFTVKAIDSTEASDTVSFTVIINPVASITTTTLPNWTVEESYDSNISLSGGTNPFTFAVTVGSLPPGLSISSSTGAITGTPSTTSGSPFDFTITATDAAGAKAVRAYAVAINSQPTITTASLLGTSLGGNYDQTIGVGGGTSPFVFSVSNGYLPVGLALDSNAGTITGTPTTTTGTFDFTIMVTDSAGAAVSKAFSIVVTTAPVITTDYLPDWTVGAPYNQTIQEEDGTGAITWSVSAGSLPPGLSLGSSTGKITGTPTSSTGSPYDFTITATDSTGASGSSEFDLFIDPAIVISPTISGWDVNQPGYDENISATGGTGSLTFTVSAGTLPPGLTLATQTGAITGTPTTTTGSPFSFTIKAEDSVGATTSQVVQIAINPAPTFTTTSLPAGTVGQAYNQTVVVSGGTAPFYLSLDGNLPVGLSFNSSTGAITGTPATITSSPSTFAVTVVDSTGAMGEATFSITINATSLTITPTTLPSGQVDETYDTTLSTEVSTPPVTWSVSEGSLPAGLQLGSTTGAITGTPTTANFLNAAIYGESAGFASSLIEDASGNFYGTLYDGGNGYGTVYKMASGTDALTTLVTFSGADGAYPYGSLYQDASGNLFGVTQDGGIGGDGTVFEIPAGTTNLITLASFNGSNGAYPEGPLVEDSSGNLYGITDEGGANMFGTVFEIATGTHALTTVVTFTDTTGEYPVGGLSEDKSGNIYGITNQGGASGDGTVFEVAVGTHAFSTLASLTQDTGDDPLSGLLVDSSGDLFGTAFQGGNNGYNDGTVFEVTAGTHTLTVVAALTTTSADPEGNLVEDAAGDLFGTSYSGGSGFGTVFEIAHGTDTLSEVAAFDGTNGSYPQSGLFEDSNGNIFGTTAYGGAANDGCVFEIAAGSQSLTALASFGTNQVLDPQAGLVADSRGDLFGTSDNDGAYGYGTVYEVAAGSQTLTPLASFNGTDGEYPQSNLIMDAGGDLFGVAPEGGANGDGTVFEVVAGSNTITTLASFNSNTGEDPIGSMYEDANGNLFGVTSEGGANGDGTLFEVAAGTHTLTALASLTNYTGGFDIGSLVEDANGDLFGATAYGGTSQDGTLFELPAGSHTITTVLSFDGTDGTNPYGLLEDSHGNIFGTTANGGAYGDGTVFEVSAGSQTVTSLVSFDGPNGANPNAGLVEDSNGDLFGTTINGAADGNGNVFEVTAGTNTLTTLVAFDDNYLGFYPVSGALAMDGSGDLYGVTVPGGLGYGTVFEVKPSAFTIEATDAANHEATQDYFIPVNPGPSITTTTLPSWTAGQAYNQTIATGVDVGPYSFAVTAGTLPQGLSLNASTGTITGVPTTASSSPFTFTITATENTGYSATQAYSIFIVSAPSPTTTTITDNGPNPSAAGTAVSFTVSVTGGIALNGGDTVKIEDASNDAVVGSGTLSNGTAVITVSSLTVGTHSLFAVYAGDTVHTGSQSSTLTQTVQAAFGVVSTTAMPNGFVLTFNAPVSEPSLLLYYSPGFNEAADVTVVGAHTGSVEGSLVLNPTAPYIATFVKTSGLLATDTYTITVTSAVESANGFFLASGYADTVSVTTPTTPVLTVPSFSRGPGQAVDAPITASGIAISISNATKVTQAYFTLTYDPTLLTIAGSGALTLSLAASTAGLTIVSYSIDGEDARHDVLTVTLSGGTGLTTSGVEQLLTITASVPATAPYLDKSVLNLGSVQVNGANATGESSVSVVAYPGDVLGTGLPNATDASLVDQVASGSGTGFSAFKDLDPVIIGGVEGGLLVNANDASLIDEAASGATVAQIPAIPIGVSLTFGGPDPYLYLSDVQGTSGQTVTETLYLDVTDPNGIQLTALDEAIGFDAGTLQISDVRGTDALAELGSYETANTIDNGSGTFLVAQAFMGTGLPPMVPYGTDIPVLQFNVTLDADMSVGSESGLTLLQYGTVNGETQYTAISDNEGALTWTPGKAPSNRGNAAIDGSVTVVAAAAPVVTESQVVTPQNPAVVAPKIIEPVRRVTPVSQPVPTTTVTNIGLLVSGTNVEMAALATVPVTANLPTLMSALVAMNQPEAAVVSSSQTVALEVVTATGVAPTINRSADPGAALSLTAVGSNRTASTGATATSSTRTPTYVLDELYRQFGSVLGTPINGYAGFGDADATEELSDMWDLDLILE